MRLYQKADMVIQETFLMTQSVTGHGSVEELLKVQEEM
jgi:hypothetical protein